MNISNEQANKIVEFTESETLRCLYANKPKEAFDQLICGFFFVPTLKHSLDGVFKYTLGLLSDNLIKDNNLSELSYYIEQTLKLFPEDCDILNILGSILFRCDNHSRAIEIFSKAIAIGGPNFLSAKRNLSNIYEYLCERWHFRMLNDITRNKSYAEAIKKAISDGNKLVLDIGTGTGLLSLIASRAGAEKVFSCDESLTMIEIAQKVFEENKCKNIILINKHSKKLQLEDLKTKVNLIIVELFDAGFFGESILQTLSDVWKRLIFASNENDIIVGNDTIKRSNSYTQVIPQRGEIYFSCIQSDSLAKSYFVQNSINHEFNNIKLIKTEPYDCENLKSYNDVIYITKPVKIFNVHLNNPEDIEEYLNGNRKTKVQLECTRSGRIDAIVSWFKLYLTDDITITTSPLEKNDHSCWDQAIFPLNVQKCVNQGEKIELFFNTQNGILEASLVTNQENSQMAIDEIFLTMPMIRYLNDNQWMKSIDKLYEEIVKKSIDSILDISPIPILGLKLIKTNPNIILTCLKENENIIRKFTNYFIGSLDQLKFIESINESELYDAVFFYPFDATGDIKSETFAKISFYINSLKPGGIFIPKSLTVIGRAIDSHYFDQVSKVDDENLLGFEIAKHINKFKMYHHLDINLNNLKYEPISHEVSMIKIDFTLDELRNYSNNKYTFLMTPITSESNIFNSIVYWYNIEFFTEIQVNTLISHLPKAAFIFDPLCKLEESSLFTIHHEEGIFDIRMHK